MRKPERSEHIEYRSLDLQFMNRTAYPTGLCRTIYDNLTIQSLSFTLNNFVVEDLVEMPDDENMV
jgi:hypothetical protein